ncbi:MAG: hypothetical protein WCI88_09515, partial [Chloroflexota bacterium]
IPILFRPALGKRVALLLSFGLAIDPGLVAISRMAGGAALALGFAFFALGFWYKRFTLMGILFSILALLSGVPIMVGGIAILLSWLVIMGLHKINLINLSDIPHEKKIELPLSLRNIIIFVIAAFIFLSTLFFRFPQGMGAFVKTFPIYLSGWINPSNIPALSIVFMLIIYQSLILIFGVLGSVRSWLSGDSLGRLLTCWVAVSFVSILIYPAHQVLDLGWVLIPLWILAAREISHWIDYIPGEDSATLGQMILLFILIILGWLNIMGLILPNQNVELNRTRTILLGGVVVLGVLATLLIGLGWTFRVAKKGLIWAILISLCLYMMSGTWSVIRNQPGSDGASFTLVSAWKQWMPSPSAGNSDTLLETVRNLGEWHYGNRKIIDITILSPDPICDSCQPSPSLRWLFRNIQSSNVVNSLKREAIPSIVVTTGDQTNPPLSSSYRGEKFSWLIYPDWQSALSTGLLRWILYRDVPYKIENVILWTRNDLFPGGQPLPQGQSETNSDPNIGAGKN